MNRVCWAHFWFSPTTAMSNSKVRNKRILSVWLSTLQKKKTFSRGSRVVHPKATALTLMNVSIVTTYSQLTFKYIYIYCILHWYQLVHDIHFYFYIAVTGTIAIHCQVYPTYACKWITPFWHKSGAILRSKTVLADLTGQVFSDNMPRLQLPCN